MVGPDLAGWKMAIDFKDSHFEREIVLWGVRWYVAYPIRHRQLEEMMGERGGRSIIPR
jgi:transposase-like protein